MTSTLNLGSKIPISEIEGTIATDEDLSLKANTDMDNVPPDGKEEVNTWGLPDLTRGVNKTWNTNYTAECNGWLFAQVQCSFTNTELYFDLNIDGKTFNVLTTTMGGGTTSSSAFHPIKKGSVYKGSRSGNASILNQALRFYPCIGEGV